MSAVLFRLMEIEIIDMSCISRFYLILYLNAPKTPQAWWRLQHPPNLKDASAGFAVFRFMS